MEKKTSPKEVVFEKKGPRKKQVEKLVGGNVLETGQDLGDHRDACRQMPDDAKKPCQAMASAGICKRLPNTEMNTMICPNFPHQKWDPGWEEKSRLSESNTGGGKQVRRWIWQMIEKKLWFVDKPQYGDPLQVIYFATPVTET